MSYNWRKSRYYKYELKNVIVSSFYSSRDTCNYVPTETITLNFDWFKITYTDFDSTGKLKGNVEFTWDLLTSRAG